MTSFQGLSSRPGSLRIQFSGSWNQCKVCACRVPFKSQFELVLSCSVLKNLWSYQEIVRLVQMLQLALGAHCSSWMIIQIKEQSIQLF